MSHEARVCAVARPAQARPTSVPATAPASGSLGDRGRLAQGRDAPRHTRNALRAAEPLAVPALRRAASAGTSPPPRLRPMTMHRASRRAPAGAASRAAASCTAGLPIRIGRVGPDLVDGQVVRHLVRWATRAPGRRAGAPPTLARRRLQRPLVDVDRPHLGARAASAPARRRAGRSRSPGRAPYGRPGRALPSAAARRCRGRPGRARTRRWSSAASARGPRPWR